MGIEPKEKELEKKEKKKKKPGTKKNWKKMKSSI